jgi:hypothetical protein
MSEVPQSSAASWREAAEWAEHSLAEGGQALRFLPPVIGWVSAREDAGQFWAHPLTWGLAISVAPELEANPHLVIWSDEDWPYYDIELRDRWDRRLLGWFCDGEGELEAALAEALGRLQGLGTGSRAGPGAAAGQAGD